MSSTTKEKVIQEAKRLISESPSGMRYSELIKKIKELLPGVPPYTIGGSFQKFRANLPPNIYMPGKGLYKDIKYKGSEEPVETTPIPASQSKIEEKEVYEPFARYLENELEGCTKAIVVGGSKFGGKKWGTPDVMGKLEMKKSAIIQPPPEIISAEIKTGSQPLIVAFGQACAYKLFSHKSYIVVPDDYSNDDISRLDALARIFGIGLVLFDKTEKPIRFQIRVRASRHEPDMFYVNEYAKEIEDELFT